MRKCEDIDYNEKMASTKADTQMSLTLKDDSKMSTNYEPVGNLSVMQATQQSSFNHTQNHSMSNSNLLKPPSDPWLTSVKKSHKKPNGHQMSSVASSVDGTRISSQMPLSNHPYYFHKHDLSTTEQLSNQENSLIVSNF